MVHRLAGLERVLTDLTAVQSVLGVAAQLQTNTNMLRLVGSLAGLGLATQLAGQKAVKAESLPWQTEKTKTPVSLDFSWLLGRKEEVRGGPGGERKVLLLAYPRTGSTLLGELLAAQPQTSYFMEPLFGVMPVGQLDWDYALEGMIETGQVPMEAVMALMAGLYSCDETVTARLEEWSHAPHTSVTAVSPSICRAVWSTLISRDPTRLGYHWSYGPIGALMP